MFPMRPTLTSLIKTHPTAVPSLLFPYYSFVLTFYLVLGYSQLTVL